MAQIIITIPDDKVTLVLDAFAGQRGIEPTSAAVKAELVREIKATVRAYQRDELLKGVPPIDVF